MKIISSLLLTIVSIIALSIAKIWVIVEFLLYLFKDSPFNWFSMYLLIISVILIVIGLISFYINK